MAPYTDPNLNRLMNMKNRIRTMSILSLLALPLMTVSANAAEPAKRIVPWDLAALAKTPAVHPTKERPAAGMKSFFYEGAEYKGKPTWVFAYYAAPEGKAPEGGWPAVVCAHGGGGTAFPDWVRQWNKNGYAAIAMDLAVGYGLRVASLESNPRPLHTIRAGWGLWFGFFGLELEAKHSTDHPIALDTRTYSRGLESVALRLALPLPQGWFELGGGVGVGGMRINGGEKVVWNGLRQTLRLVVSPRQREVGSILAFRLQVEELRPDFSFPFREIALTLAFDVGSVLGPGPAWPRSR